MTLAQINPAKRTPHAKYDRLIAAAKEVPPATTIAVHPCDETSLRGCVDAAQAGMIIPILVGPAAKIASVARDHELDIGAFEIIDAEHSDAAAAKAVELVHQGKGELLMKGSLHTDELMRAITSALSSATPRAKIRPSRSAGSNGGDVQRSRGSTGCTS